MVRKENQQCDSRTAIHATDRVMHERIYLLVEYGSNTNNLTLFDKSKVIPNISYCCQRHMRKSNNTVISVEMSNTKSKRHGNYLIQIEIKWRRQQTSVLPAMRKGHVSQFLPSPANQSDLFPQLRLFKVRFTILVSKIASM